MTWLQALATAQARGDASVLITIDKVTGSAPRGVGARMLLGRRGAVDTIGGGALELAALSHARRLLNRADPQPCIERGRFTLGKALSRDSDGQAILSFAYQPACDFRIEVFGAGNVGLELARLARRLPCIATFHDPRPVWLARLGADLSARPPVEPSRYVDASAGDEVVPTGIRPDIELPSGLGVPVDGPGRLIARPLGADVAAAVDTARPGSLFVVMTHAHELDLEVCEAVLTRGDAACLGLVASRSKAARFRARLSRMGFDDEELRGLTAPLGRRVPTGNTPMEVAIAAMADVLTAREVARRKALAEQQAEGAGRAAGADGSGDTTCAAKADPPRAVERSDRAAIDGAQAPADRASPDVPESRRTARQTSSE